MKYYYRPFEISALPEDLGNYARRFENAIIDLEFFEKGELYFAVDTFVLLEAYIGNDYYQQGRRFREFLNRDDVKLTIFPETIIELTNKLQQAYNRTKNLNFRYIREVFVEKDEVRAFIDAVEDEDWSRAYSQILKLYSAVDTKATTRNLMSLVYVFDLEQPISALRKFLKRKRLVHINDIASRFGLEDVDPNQAVYAEAFGTLARRRGNKNSDLRDARIYGRVYTLNQAGSFPRQIKAARFLSHETMVDYLESSSRFSAAERQVRSTIDIAVLDGLLTNARSIRTELEDWITLAREAAKEDDFSDDSHRRELKREIEILLRKIGIEPGRRADGDRNRADYIVQLVRERVESLFQILREICDYGITDDSKVSQLNKKLIKLHNILTDRSHGAESLDEFRERLDKELDEIRSAMAQDRPPTGIADEFIEYVRLSNDSDKPMDLVEAVIQSEIDVDDFLMQLSTYQNTLLEDMIRGESLAKRAYAFCSEVYASLFNRNMQVRRASRESGGLSIETMLTHSRHDSEQATFEWREYLDNNDWDDAIYDDVEKLLETESNRLSDTDPIGAEEIRKVLANLELLRR